MLIGLCGAEAVSKSAVSAAQGFLGCASCCAPAMDLLRPHLRTLQLSTLDSATQLHSCTSPVPTSQPDSRLVSLPAPGGSPTWEHQRPACRSR